MKIILASASPRRKELLQQIGWDFQIQVSDVVEIITKKIPHEIVEELSYQKAIHVRAQIINQEEDFCIIGADTIVASGERILGKPENEEKAKEMLGILQNNSHYVYTGVTLCYGKNEVNTFYEATKVSFYPMNEKEIEEYVATGEPMDKAGAYGIQGFGAKYIRQIDGDYNNVVGLPVGRLYQEILHKKGFIL